MLRVRGLTVRYEAFVALDGLDLEVAAGRCLALLGHNGSGKSTAIGAIGGQVHAAAGEVEIGAITVRSAADAAAVRAALSLVPDAPAFYPDLTIREHLQLVALAHGLGDDAEATIDATLDELDLGHRGEFLAQQLSSGMRQKAQLACALVRPFDLLVLDEPTSFLDRRAEAVLHDRLAAELERGAAVLLSCHDPAFVRDLADEVVVLEDGVVGARGSYDEALASDAAARSGLRGG